MWVELVVRNDGLQVINDVDLLRLCKARLVVPKKHAGVVPEEVRLQLGCRTKPTEPGVRYECSPPVLALDCCLAVRREAREWPVDVDGVDARLSYMPANHTAYRRSDSVSFSWACWAPPRVRGGLLTFGGLVNPDDDDPSGGKTPTRGTVSILGS